MEQNKTKPVCTFCGPVWQALELAEREGRMDYGGSLELLDELERQGHVRLAAGDCLAGEALSTLAQETHYTVRHYYRCCGCGQVFFVGACIRGTPIFRAVERLEDEQLERVLWGRIGTEFTEEQTENG